MSTFTNHPVPRITVNFKFAYVPSMILPEPYEPLEPISRPPPSDGAATTHKTASVTSTQAKAKDPDVRHRHKIPREEPCFITGSISYIHEQAHWVNAVRNKNTTMQDGRERPVRNIYSLGKLLINPYPMPKKKGKKQIVSTTTLTPLAASYTYQPYFLQQDHLSKLCVVPEDFNLDSPGNLVNCEYWDIDRILHHINSQI